MSYKETDIQSFSLAPFKEIGDNWGILSAGDEKSFNSMTVSWGAAGVLWSKNCIFVFVRPQRHTFGFTESSERFSLSLMPEGYHKKIAVFGSKSGRDCDKYAESGILPGFYNGVPYCGEAQTVFVCRKLSSADITADWFADKGIISENYKNGDYHRMYVGEIEAILKKDGGND